MWATPVLDIDRTQSVGKHRLRQCTGQLTQQAEGPVPVPFLDKTHNGIAGTIVQQHQIHHRPGPCSGLCRSRNWVRKV
jgi:hypothetical protein